jgi:hypothetical protein
VLVALDNNKTSELTNNNAKTYPDLKTANRHRLKVEKEVKNICKKLGE